MTDEYEKLKLFSPEIDCGYCGNATCGAFLRKLYWGEERVDSCLFISEEKRKKMEEILKIKRKKVVKSEVKEGTLQFSPCAEKEKVTMEVRLPLLSKKGYSLLDSCDMCLTLSSMKSMDRFSCSKKMGYAVALIRGKRVHIFKNGKLILRRADSKEEALEILKMMKIAMRPSVINICGNTLSDCLLCHDFFKEKEHTIGFSWGREEEMKGKSFSVLHLFSLFLSELVSEEAKTLSFLKELEKRLDTLTRKALRDEKTLASTSEIYSAAIDFQNRLTALAIEKAISEADNIEKNLYCVVVHGITLSLTRAVEAWAELLKFFYTKRKEMKKSSLKKVETTSELVEALSRLLIKSISFLMYMVEADLKGELSLLKEAEELSKEVLPYLNKLKEDMEEITRFFSSDDVKSVMANIWKLFNNATYLFKLSSKRLSF